MSHPRPFLTIACLSASEVLLQLLKASAAVLARRSASSTETPLRVTMGSFVLGEMVVITSTDILTAIYEEQRRRARWSWDGLFTRRGFDVFYLILFAQMNRQQ